MTKLAADLNQRPRLFDDGEDMARAARIVAMRNLITHNRAVINRTFLDQVPDFEGKEGDRLTLTTGVFGEADFLARCVAALDQRAVQKFGLPASVRTEASAEERG